MNIFCQTGEKQTFSVTSVNFKTSACTSSKDSIFRMLHFIQFQTLLLAIIATRLQPPFSFFYTIIGDIPLDVPYACNHNPLWIRNCYRILTMHNEKILRKKPVEKTFSDFKKWIKV